MITDINEEKNEILSVLEEEKKALSISSIAQKTGINRHAVARHLDLMEILGKVRKIEIGRSKKYLSVMNLPISGLIDISSDLILIFNTRLHLQYLNISAARYFNTSLPAIIGKKFEDLHFSLLSGTKILKKLSVFSFEKPEHIIVRDDNGQWFEITIIGFALAHAYNQIAIICTDISEKKRSEEELRIAQEKYANAFLSSPDGIIMSSLITGEIIEVNPSYCNLLGYSWEELVGKSSVDLGILDSGERSFLIQNTIMKDFGKCCYDIKVKKKSGEIFDVSVSSSIIRIEEKEYLLTVIRDISDRKKNEELYHLLADNIKDVIWVLDPYTEIITYVSPSIFKIYGYSPEEVIGHPYSDFLSEEFYSLCNRKLKRLLESYESGDDSVKYGRIEVIQKHHDGHEVTIEFSTTYVAGTDRKVTHVVGVSRDITGHIVYRPTNLP